MFQRLLQAKGLLLWELIRPTVDSECKRPQFHRLQKWTLTDPFLGSLEHIVALLLDVALLCQSQFGDTFPPFLTTHLAIDGTDFTHVLRSRCVVKYSLSFSSSQPSKPRHDELHCMIH